MIIEPLRASSLTSSMSAKWSLEVCIFNMSWICRFLDGHKLSFNTDVSSLYSNDAFILASCISLDKKKTLL